MVYVYCLYIDTFFVHYETPVIINLALSVTSLKLRAIRQYETSFYESKGYENKQLRPHTKTPFFATILRS